MIAIALRLAGVVLLLTALALALSRAPDRAPETLVARWAPAPSDFVEVDGLVVHLRDEGPRDDPLPLVLLHGTASSLHTWQGWVAALKPRRRVITFDLPGFGLTGPYPGSAGAADGAAPADEALPERDARFVVALLDALKLPRVVLGGNSLGGEIAWRTAVLAPQRVAALVLVDASGPAFRPDAVPLGFLVARAPVIGRLTEWVLPRAMVAQGLVALYGDPARLGAETVDRHFELLLREGNRRALRRRLQAFAPGRNDAGIDTLRLPTLIVWGERDRLIPPAVGADFERRIPGSRRVVLPGLGHLPQEEDPAASVVPVRAFLAALG